MIVRYEKCNDAIEERFSSILAITTDRTAEAICKIVSDIDEKLQCDTELDDESYDGVS